MSVTDDNISLKLQVCDFSSVEQRGKQSEISEIRKTHFFEDHSKLFNELLRDEEPSSKNITIVPSAENVDFIERGTITIRVMDKHNFYEAEALSEEELKNASLGLLTKIWISISRSLKE